MDADKIRWASRLDFQRVSLAHAMGYCLIAPPGLNSIENSDVRKFPVNRPVRRSSYCGG